MKGALLLNYMVVRISVFSVGFGVDDAIPVTVCVLVVASVDFVRSVLGKVQLQRNRSKQPLEIGRMVLICIERRSNEGSPQQNLSSSRSPTFRDYRR